MDPKADGFFTYGAWKPEAGHPELQEMLDRIHEDGEVIVELQKPEGLSSAGKGYIFELPEQTIEVRCDPSLNSDG